MNDQRMAYSASEAAHALGVSERTFRTMIAKERVRIVRVGRRVLIPAEALRELLTPAAA